MSVNTCLSQGDLCSVWQEKMDTTSNVDFAISYSKQIISKVSIPCQVKVSGLLGDAYLLKGKIDSAEFYFKQSIQTGLKNNVGEELAQAYFKYSSLFLDKGKEEKAKIYLSRCKRILSKYPSSPYWIGYYSNKAKLADFQSQFYDALTYVDSTLIIATEINDSLEMTGGFHNLGVYYLRLGNYPKASEYLLEALRYKKEFKDDEISSTYYVLGTCYSRWGQVETGLDFLKKGIEHTENKGNELLLIKLYVAASQAERKLNNFESLKKYQLLLDDRINSISNPSILADIYLEKYRFKKIAEQDLDKFLITKAKELILKGNDKLLQFSIWSEYVKFELETGNFNEAEKAYLELEQLSEKINQLSYYYRLNELASQLYREMNKDSLALFHLEKSIQIKDSIQRLSVQHELAQLERKFQLGEKETEILELNEKFETQKSTTNKVRSFNILLIILIAVILCAFLFFMWSYRKIRRQRKELHSSNQTKAKLFSIVSHDLKGMVLPFQRAGKVIGYYSKKKDFEKTIELTNELENNASRLSDTLNNLLHWSIQQQEGYVLTNEEFNLCEEINNIILDYLPAAENKNIELILTKNIVGTIESDLNAFRIILRNLISNAIKYTSQGSISISVEPKEIFWAIQVKDSGVGISEQILSQINSKQTISSSDGTKGEKGTGLGLSIVQLFIGKLNGELHIESEVNSGTMITVILPHRN